MASLLGSTLRCCRRSRLLLPLLLVTPVCAHNMLFGASVASGSQESSAPAYHSSVSEVRLVFFATDEHNQPVTDLQEDDFAVVDDERVIRDFRSFTRSALTKLDVIVLIDSSESVQPHLQEEIADVVQLISQWPWNPGDYVSVLSFSGIEVHLICAGNCRSVFTAAQVTSLPRGGATPLFDALEIATNTLMQRRETEAWPVIILFSDGDDTVSKTSLREALEKVLASGAQVYAIDVSSPERASDGTARLQRIAAESGGRWVRMSEGAVRIFRDVIDDLHSARVVTYVLPESGPDFHSIRILPTHNLNLQFRCRTGYYHREGSAY